VVIGPEWSSTQAGAGMSEERAAFWRSVELADVLLRSAELRAGWAADSALAGMSAGDLAAHLARQVHLVAEALDNPPPSGPTLSPAAYYATVLGDQASDPDSPVNDGVRRRSRADAAGGPEAVLAGWSESVATARARLERTPADRLVSVASAGLVLTIDDYLVTRVVELCLHTDDLAVGLGVDPPPFPIAVTTLVAHTLIDIARLRNGDLAVVRALARRERQAPAVVYAF
jgi:hypothetical protein